MNRNFSVIAPLVICGLFACLSPFAFANVSTIGVNSAPSGQDSAGEYIGPYYGPFYNGQTTTTPQIFCDDLNHVIYLGAAPTAVNVSTINNLSKTRFGGLPNAKAEYEQIFFLSSFLTQSFSANYYPGFSGGVNSGNATVQADVQDAIWGYFAPNAANAGTNQINYWRDLAAADYATRDYSGYRILTDYNNQSGGVQELFIAPTPEPGFYLITFIGCAALAFALYRRRLTAAPNPASSSAGASTPQN